MDFITALELVCVQTDAWLLSHSSESVGNPYFSSVFYRHFQLHSAAGGAIIINDVVFI